ncbi:MAG: hypothetical protein RDU20_18465 [Desulfomonilaceae bacterium]|nr:hypothetical protein [Desulfomonilaceae bacterium]
MSAKRVVNAKDIVEDIRAGMSDKDLMTKYRLSSRGLQSAFSKLVNNRILSVEEVYGQPRSTDDDTVIIDDISLIQKHYLTVTASIYEADKPEIVGRLHEITERGLTVIGIQARIGEEKSFVIPCKEFLPVDRIAFRAECLWANVKPGTGQWVGGYQITSISKGSLIFLRDLIKLLTLG